MVSTNYCKDRIGNSQELMHLFRKYCGISAFIYTLLVFKVEYLKTISFYESVTPN